MKNDSYRTTEINIDGFDVFFESDSSITDGGATQCHIVGKKLSGSLALLENTGCLTDNNGNDRPISKNTIRRIVAWAHAQGY